MKTILGILLSSVALTVNSATWTFHGTACNPAQVKLSDSAEHWMIQWDHDWDAAFPGDADSGVYHAFSGFGWDSTVIGYSDDYTVTISDSAWLARVVIYGPFPDYSPEDGHLYWPGGTAWNGEIIPPATSVSSPPPGEYWIDWSPSGVARLSTSKPSDFGKWNRDGSTSSCWVEPLTAAPSPGKGKKLGHSK